MTIDYNIFVIREANQEDKKVFNKLATHPLQSWEWGDFRKQTGVEVSRFLELKEDEIIASYQVTWHRLPYINKVVGYCPKSLLPSKEFTEYLVQEGNERRAVMIKFEPNVKTSENKEELNKELFVVGKPLFTKYTFILDINKKEEELLANLNQKTRYNVKVATKKGVSIVEDNSEEAFEEYWKLTEETTKRQGFYSHTKSYHQKMWKEMTDSGMGRLLLAKYQGEVLTAWFVFILNKKIYYPYGASSTKNREVMASNLMMWEVIRLGLAEKCSEFDMWGSLGPDPDTSDSWYGFHKFKQGYGGKIVEFVGTYDLVVSRPWYLFYQAVDGLRWKVLRLLRR